MKYDSIKFREFLKDNGISAYFLHHSIKKKIRNFENQVTLFNATHISDDFRRDYFDELSQVDEEIQQLIRAYLIEKVKQKATNDKEILIALKKLKWTKAIKESELRQMGLQSSLFWNTTIMGKLKLTRIGDYTPIYYVLNFGEALKLEEVVAPYKVIKNKIIEEPV